MIVSSTLHLYQLRRNLRSGSLKLGELQNKKLATILKHAYENVPFYHERFRSAGLKPGDIRTVEDLRKLPFTSKSDVQAFSSSFYANNVDKKKCTERLTSGSTGIPLTVAVDTDAINFENALWARSYFEDGMKPWHKMLRITDPHNFAPSHWFHHLGLMRTKFVSVFDDNKKLLSVIEEYKPDIIRGYTSCVETFAMFCADNKLHTKPKLVFTSAELLDKKARKTIALAFGTEPFDMYVSVEFGPMAWECREHSGYHINADGLILEFVDNGEAVAPGERGEIVCTSLFNNVFPLIRYRIGDAGIRSDERCSCGVTLPLMKILEGRTGDYLIALDGRKVPPIVFFPFPFDDSDVTGIKQFKIIQERRDKLVIMIVARNSLGKTEEIFRKAERNLKSIFGENMQVTFRMVDKIQRDPTGKLRKIVSKVEMDDPV
jgi:phenylacetate-CoA ligase